MSECCYQCDLYLKRIQELEKRIQRLQNNDQSHKDEVYCNEQIDLSEDTLEIIVNEKYTEDLFYQGKNGIISFIYNHIVQKGLNQKFSYVCIDLNKKLFQYIDFNGDECVDIRCRTLLNNLESSLLKKVKKIYNTTINRIYKDENKDDCEDDISDDEIDEVIVSELMYTENNSIVEKSIDDQINTVAYSFLEIKKIFKNKKFIIDELSKLLYV